MSEKICGRDHKLLLYSGIYDRNPSEQSAEMRDFPRHRPGTVGTPKIARNFISGKTSHFGTIYL